LLGVLALVDADRTWSRPEELEELRELVAVLTDARARLRRRLLLAEGLDPQTGQLEP
jgi:hypothetical protein